MVNFFQSLKKQPTIENAQPTASATEIKVQGLAYPFIQFDSFAKGIDNVHIDVCLSPQFTTFTQQLVYAYSKERIRFRKELIFKPSPAIQAQLNEFNSRYNALATAIIHRTKENKNIELIKLFQVSLIKFILYIVNNQVEQLATELKSATLGDGTSKSQQHLELYHAAVWLNQQKNSLIYQIIDELFNQIRWVETSVAERLREALLGVTTVLPLQMLLNPLLQSKGNYDHEILMTHYVLFSQDNYSHFHFSYLHELIEKIFEEIVKSCSLIIKENIDAENIHIGKINSSNHSEEEISFSWHDVPENIAILFELAEENKANTEDISASIKVKLKCLQRAYKILEHTYHHSQISLAILAAYETPRLYQYYLHLLKPSLIYQVLSGEISIDVATYKLQNELKIKPLRQSEQSPPSITELANAQKQLRRVLRQDKGINSRFIHFLKDIISYRRDLKYCHLMLQAFDKINLLTQEQDIQLSRSNGMIYEFLLEKEYPSTTNTIRCHTIVKADLRGSTTVTSELCKRGLNPATHFSRNFFNPISKLVEVFGAEKVFIEGDAVILSLFESQNQPEHWLSTARACGLAREMLDVVHKQNQVSTAHRLPILELGIGICYSPEAPAFLYDGQQRIMISPAIGDADRLSSCSWKLRRKYEHQKLYKRVMVFKQPPTDAFKGEKGMTTFRYNLNGIELDQLAFKKLQTEIALRTFSLKLPDDDYKNQFYAGTFTDAEGETHMVVVREDKVRLWQENTDHYPILDEYYYEVVTHPEILKYIKQKW